MDIPAAIQDEFARVRLASRVQPGMRIAVAAGSRGVANIDVVVGSVVKELKALGTRPYIIPAMGSHGGGTAEGQRKVLKNYGISEETMGVPIYSSMEVVQVGTAPQGFPIYVDKYALEADGIILINRIKPHTNFKGELGSGLMKMMAIGLGKRQGAEIYHRAMSRWGPLETIRTIASMVLKHCNILLGVGIVENGYDQTAILLALKPEEIATREPELLQKARELMAKLPFEEIDLLIVDEIGKEISGTGMDSNVIGRVDILPPGESQSPQISRIYVRDLTEKTQGNAVGIGLADLVHRRAVNKIDYKATYINCITSGSLAKCKIPLICETDQEALEIALSVLGIHPLEAVKVVWIKNTLELSEMRVSEAFWKEVQNLKHVTALSEPEPVQLNSEGNLL
ncbi:MAG TPA: lactate racemase domain-containing protein [Candidatus Limnocylindrales bacterium]|nr:lactate racemase domain-containing protein [Candidatus Limnocylindrales bacterium]